MSVFLFMGELRSLHAKGIPASILRDCLEEIPGYLGLREQEQDHVNYYSTSHGAHEEKTREWALESPETCRTILKLPRGEFPVLDFEKAILLSCVLPTASYVKYNVSRREYNGTDRSVERINGTLSLIKDFSLNGEQLKSDGGRGILRGGTKQRRRWEQTVRDLVLKHPRNSTWPAKYSRVATYSIRPSHFTKRCMETGKDLGGLEKELFEFFLDGVEREIIMQHILDKETYDERFRETYSRWEARILGTRVAGPTPYEDILANAPGERIGTWTSYYGPNGRIWI